MPDSTQRTITVEGDFIVFRDTERPFIIKIDSLTLIEYVPESELAHVIASNDVNTHFPCTKQQFDKLINDISKK